MFLSPKIYKTILKNEIANKISFLKITSDQWTQIKPKRQYNWNSVKTFNNRKKVMS